MTFQEFLNAEREDLLNVLNRIVVEKQDDMEKDPEDYKDFDGAEPTIDIRLCIDRNDDSWSWIFRTGLVDYDPVHSDFCAASCISLHTKTHGLFAELIEQIEAQIFDAGLGEQMTETLAVISEQAKNWTDTEPPPHKEDF